MDKFTKICWEEMKDSDDVDRVVYMLKQIRKHMLKHSTFKRLSIASQVAQCVTIGCMVLETSTADLRELHILRKKDRGNLEHDILNGFKKPDYIEIKNKTKLLPNGTRI